MLVMEVVYGERILKLLKCLYYVNYYFEKNFNIYHSLFSAHDFVKEILTNTTVTYYFNNVSMSTDTSVTNETKTSVLEQISLFVLSSNIFFSKR